MNTIRLMNTNSRHNLLSVMTRAAVSLVIIAIGLGIAGALYKTKPGVAQREAGDAILRVESMVAQRVPVHRIWEGFGTANVRDAANVSSEIETTVIEVPDAIRPGAVVTQGQTLARLNPIDVQHREQISQQILVRLHAQMESLAIQTTRLTEQLELINDELVISTANYERILKSFERKAANQSELDAKRRDMKSVARLQSDILQKVEMIDPQRAELNASVAEENARLAAIRTDLDRCTITSPIDGIVQTIEIDEGERVSPGTPIARVVSLNRIEVPLQLPISARQKIKVGDAVQLFSEGAVSNCWFAEVARLSPESDVASRTCTVYAEIVQSAEDDPLLIPGQYVRAVFESAQAQEYLVIPRRAVLDRGVWVVDDQGQAELRGIDRLFHFAGSFDGIDSIDQEWVVLSVDSDVHPGDTVILSNLDELRIGLKVSTGIWSVDSSDPVDGSHGG